MAIYTEEIASTICDRLSEGESLLSICAEEGMPDRTTVRRWHRGLGGAPESFCIMYTRARLDQADSYFEQLIELSDDAAEEPTSEKTNAARLQSDNRKWSLARMSRAKYGDRTALDHGNQPDNPLTASKEAQAAHDALPDEVKKAIRKSLQDKMMAEGTPA